MTLIQMIPIAAAFQRGVTVFRNAREWAMGKRDEFVDAANTRRQTTARMQTNVTAGTQTTASAQNTSITSCTRLVGPTLYFVLSNWRKSSEEDE